MIDPIKFSPLNEKGCVEHYVKIALSKIEQNHP